MRKLIIVILGLIMVIMLVGCGQQQGTIKDNQKESNTPVKHEMNKTENTVGKQDEKEREEDITPVSEQTVVSAEPIRELPGMIEYSSFSYEEDKESIDLQLVSVKTDGFVNTGEIEMDGGFPSAIERAKAEVDIDYDLIQTFYDSAECVWKVLFSNSKQMGGNEVVYLNTKGVTLLIVKMGYE